jgi:hypothetical protein
VFLSEYVLLLLINSNFLPINIILVYTILAAYFFVGGEWSFVIVQRQGGRARSCVITTQENDGNRVS